MNRPAPFPGRMSYKATKLGLVLFYILACFNSVVAYWGPLLCIVNFRWYVFCLLVVLVKLSLLAKLLARKTPLRKPNRGDGIISIKPRPKRAYHCVIFSRLDTIHRRDRRTTVNHRTTAKTALTHSVTTCAVGSSANYSAGTSH